MGDAPFGLFISGGVDSSIIASIVMRLVKSGEIDIKKRGMTKVLFQYLLNPRSILSVLV
jgi:asparagine synthase (glutamine-hydrolysing)